MSETDLAIHLLREEYNRLDEANEIAISPACLATTVYAILDPLSERKTPVAIQVLAILQLRQLARGICHERDRSEQEMVEGQATLFQMRLQRRYPVRREEEENSDPRYVLRSELTLAERNLNIARLRREAESKNNHADALQGETNALLRAGKLGISLDTDDDTVAM